MGEGVPKPALPPGWFGVTGDAFLVASMLSDGLAAKGDVGIDVGGTVDVAVSLSLTAFFSLLGLEVLLVEAPSVDESDESPEADDDDDDDPLDEEDDVGSSLMVEFRSRMDLFWL